VLVKAPPSLLSRASSFRRGKRRFAKTSFDALDINRVPGISAIGSLALDNSDARDYILDCPTEHLC
jgi:hypothetical protein